MACRPVQPASRYGTAVARDAARHFARRLSALLATTYGRAFLPTASAARRLSAKMLLLRVKPPRSGPHDKAAHGHEAIGAGRGAAYGKHGHQTKYRLLSPRATKYYHENDGRISTARRRMPRVIGSVEKRVATPACGRTAREYISITARNMLCLLGRPSIASRRSRDIDKIMREYFGHSAPRHAIAERSTMPLRQKGWQPSGWPRPDSRAAESPQAGAASVRFDASARRHSEIFPVFISRA